MQSQIGLGYTWPRSQLGGPRSWVEGPHNQLGGPREAQERGGVRGGERKKMKHLQFTVCDSTIGHRLGLGAAQKAKVAKALHGQRFPLPH